MISFWATRFCVLLLTNPLYLSEKNIQPTSDMRNRLFTLENNQLPPLKKNFLKGLLYQSLWFFLNGAVSTLFKRVKKGIRNVMVKHQIPLNLELSQKKSCCISNLSEKYSPDENQACNRTTGIILFNIIEVSTK